MAISYTADQLNTVSKLQQICATILDNLADAQLLTQEASDKGYGSGGTNAITDNLLNGTNPAPYPQLGASDVFASVTAIQAIISTLSANTRQYYKALERMRP